MTAVTVDAPITGTNGRALSARGERTRRRLLDTAEQVFADLGYHDASIAKITELAGVAMGTFYLYFASKQEVFEALVADLNRRVRRAMSEGAATGSTRVDAERGGFAAFFRFTAEHPGLYRVIREAEFVAPAALADHYRSIAAGYVAALRAAMDAGEIVRADPEVLAYALMGVGELIGQRYVLGDGAPGKVPPRVLDVVAAFVARGLGAAT